MIGLTQSDCLCAIRSRTRWSIPEDAAWTYGGLWISVWHPFLSGRPARMGAIIELIEYMQSRGNVWFARLDEICDHVNRLIAEHTWQPRIESMPVYHSPLPELSKPGA